MKNILLFASAMILLSACGGGSKGTPEEQLVALKQQRTTLDNQIAELEKQVGKSNKAPKVRTVGLTEIKTEKFQHFIDLQGKIEAEESVMATSRMPGALTSVLVKNGDNVRKGQLIATVDDAILQKSLAELEGQLKVAEDIYNRQKGLWDQKIGTEVQYIQAKNGKESLERTMNTLREQMGMTRIYAPTSGTVDMVMLKQGQAIAPGMPLCNIVNLSKLKVKGAVTEAYASKVKKGDKVQVFFPDINKEVTTTVTYVAKTINPMTRTFDVECALPAGNNYSANQLAVMKIVDYQSANAVAIPVNLIQSSADGDFVLIVDKSNGTQAPAQKVMVKQGSNYNGKVEILKGLKAGDWVISTGFQDVNNGEVVNF